MIVLLGVDDTDNPTSRGTGYQARHLGKALGHEELAEVLAVTRHQLLLDPQIDYTSRNSSACLVLEASEGSIPSIRALTRTVLRSHCAADSNAGVCIAPASTIDSAIQEFGNAAKLRLLTLEETLELAEEQSIFLESLVGTGSGIIGALAAVGLHRYGSDGRFIWLPGLRELSGTYTVQELMELLHVEITTISGEALPIGAEISIGDWIRPVLREGRAILLADKEKQNGQIEWRLVDKPTVKTLSN